MAEHGLNEEILRDVFDVMPDDMPLLFASFALDSEQRLAVISDALAVGDADAVRRAAHSMKGGALGLGASDFAALCKTLEQAGSDAQMTVAAECAARLARELPLLIETLQQWYCRVSGENPCRGESP